MADFEKAIPLILKWEGGYVDHPADPGGATNMGIIFSIFVNYADEFHLPKTKDGLKQLHEIQAKAIYRKQFWDRMQGDKIVDQQIAEIIFDAYVNCGKNGIKIAQREAGTKADGNIGSNSLQAINSANPRILFAGIKDARIKYYQDLAVRKPTLQVFIKGWMNRINSFVYK